MGISTGTPKWRPMKSVVINNIGKNYMILDATLKESVSLYTFIL